MALQVTQAGLQAAANARSSGFLIAITDFQVSEAVITPSASDSAMVGPVVYSGNIDVIEVLDSATVKFILSVPMGIPQSGQWALSELGLFMSDGTLFAHGNMVPAYPKPAEVGSRIHVLIALANLGDVINVTVGQVNSIPSVAFVHNLPRPIDSYENTIAVLDEWHNTDISVSPSVAIKYGENWGYVGWDRVYYGPPLNVISTHEFNLVPQDNGFFLEDMERVIVQIVTGNGSGYSRKFRYMGLGQFKETENLPFGQLDASNTIAIWKRSVPMPLRGALSYVPVRLSYVTDLANTWAITLPFVPESYAHIWVFVEGVWQTLTTGMLQGANLTLTGFPIGTTVDIFGLQAQEASVNTIFTIYQYDFIADGLRRTWQFGEMPKDDDHILVFVNGIYQNTTYYQRIQDTVSFPVPLLAMDTVSILALRETVKSGAVPSPMILGSTTLSGSTYTLANDFINNNALITLDGVLQRLADFTLTSPNVTISSTPSDVEIKLLEFSFTPPDRLLAYKYESDQAVISAELLGTTLRLYRQNGTHFDVSGV